MDKQLTFKDLDMMIDTWTNELQNFENLFFNQLNHTKKVFWNVGNNHAKVNELSPKLNTLRCLNLQLDEELDKSYCCQQLLEEKITELEKVVVILEERSPVDINRERIYGITQNINCLLKSYSDETELMSKEFRRKDGVLKRDSIEQLACVLMKLLEKLEAIEINIEQIKSRIQYIECIRNDLLRNRILRICNIC